MSDLDDAFKAAESLDPDDRLRLIARLWATLPEEYWAAPTAHDRADVNAMLAGDDTERMAGLPHRIAWQVVGSGPVQKIYSAPRRFDLATIFVVTSAYSLLFAVMSAMTFDPMASLIVGGFITSVGIGQALLFGGRNARVASVVTGAVLGVPLVIVLVGMTRRGFRGEEVIWAIPLSAMFGAGFGYLAGVLVGGVFLVADAIRKWFLRPRVSDEEAVELTKVELTKVDAD